jgi:hypothetical protein
MHDSLIVVEGLVATDQSDIDLREEAWSFALDQRAFGPRRLLVAFSDASGRFHGLAHTARMDPPELALGPCIEHVGSRSAVAIADCDEEVVMGAPPPPDLPLRFAVACAVAADHGVHLVDWIACDDQTFRSSRIAVHPGTEWWSVPEDGAV